jgi:hypothetical protein
MGEYMKKGFLYFCLTALAVLGLSTCNIFGGGELYQEKNENGFRAVALEPGFNGNLNRLSFGVSSRTVEDRVLVGTDIRPWGCVIQDSAEGDIDPDPVQGRRIIITSINETNNAGKIAGSEDGIAYYFKEVDKDTNFRISADFYINNFGFTRGRSDLNGQEAFGIMARDYVPQHEDNGGGFDLRMDKLKDVAWNGVYWNGKNTTLDDGISGSSNMLMVGGVKRGARVYWRTGVTDPGGRGEPIYDPSAIANADFAKFAFLPKEMIDYSIYGSGKTGIESRPDFPSAGLTYKLYLEKTNSGFKARIEPPAGIGKGVTKNRLVKDGEILEYSDRELAFPDMLFEVEKEKYYVGFFAARDARVTITNIKYEESPVDKCPPRVDPEPEPVAPTFGIHSPSAVSEADYILYARSNVEGLMSLRINGGDPLVYEGAWVTEPSNASAEPFSLFEVKDIQLLQGDNVFDMVFFPDKKQEKSKYLQGVEWLMTNTSPIYSTFVVNLRSLNTPDGKIWVSPAGRATNAGTRENPMDVRTAVAIVAPGQTIMLMDGVYTPMEEPTMVDGLLKIPIRMTIPRYNSGRPNPAAVADPANPTLEERDITKNPDYYKYYKRLEAENRNMAIFDFRKDLAGWGYHARSFELQGDYWWIEGIHVRNAYDSQKGMTVMGSHNVISWVKSYFNGDTGIQVSGRNNEPKSMWPSHNRIQYCESFGNADDGITNADGFAAKLTCGPGNVFYRTISHHNIDDGYDLFAKKETGPIGAMLIQECFAYANGRYLNDEMARNYPSSPDVVKGDSTKAGGNGFKMGGEGIPVLHHAIDCLSFWNDGDGFTSNSDPAIRLTHTTSVDNYHRIDSNPGSNYAIYSASSASYEGLDAVITQVFSWWTDDQGITGHRGDRLEPKSPSSGYVWRNYTTWAPNSNDFRDSTNTIVNTTVTTANFPNGKTYGILNTSKEPEENIYSGKSVSTQYIDGKWSSSASAVAANRVSESSNLNGWNKYIDGRVMTDNDFVDSTMVEPPFARSSPWEPLPGESRIVGDFLEVEQSGPRAGLPQLGNYMKLKDIGGITPGARGLW